MPGALEAALLAGGAVALAAQDEPDEVRDHRGELDGANPPSRSAPVGANLRVQITGGGSGLPSASQHMNAEQLNSDAITQAMDEKIAQAKADLEKRWNEMDCEARKAAAKRMNAEFGTELPVDCSELDWGTVFAAASFAAGTALCGPTCGAVGAMVYSMFEKDLEEFLDGTWESIEGWANDAWDTATGWVSDIF